MQQTIDVLTRPHLTPTTPPAACAPPPVVRPGDDGYGQLKRRIVSAGLLDRDPRRHVGSSVRLFLVAALVAAGMVCLGKDWWVLAWAVPGALVFGQLGLLAHDATHSQVMRTSRQNRILALLLFNLCIGGSRGWWASRHTVHHAQPNRLGVDPDIEGGVIGVDPTQAVAARGAVRVVMRQQARVITPLLTLAALQMRVQGACFVGARARRDLGAETSLLVTHYLLYAGSLLLFLGWGRGLLFFLVQHMVLGLYLGGAFLTNHAGMKVLASDDDMDFLHRQVLTTRNIRSGPIADYLFGPLSCQVEHHLFPTMPRYALRSAAPIVRGFCAEQGIVYTEAGAWSAVAAVYRHLGAVASHCTARDRSVPRGVDSR